ncbi:MAG: HDOD domain-containing protein [Acidobacteriota bacterium]|nr:HDOD domain-containing protein [Acidobacteriota bacterium]
MASPLTALGDNRKMPAKPNTCFVARQPIFTANERIFGYELLFRDGVEDHFHSTDPEAASRSMLDSSVLMGLDMLCDGKRGFINCTREILLKDYITLLPSTQTVVEIVDSVPADDLVIAACQRLKEAGYLIALDNFKMNDPRQTLTHLVDILKVDVRQKSPEECAALVKRYGPWKSRMLAEKIETAEKFAAAKAAGFLYFQGYFFRKPEILEARKIPANRAGYLRLLQITQQPTLDPLELEKIIKGEASLCYRLLRYLNSDAFGFATEIRSVQQALAMMGEREVRRWIRLVTTLAPEQHQSTELVFSALVRARLCELLSPKLPAGENDLFLMGLLSRMDAILETPMARILENVPLDQEIKAVLLGGVGRLRPLYQLMITLEARDMQAAGALASVLSLTTSDVSAILKQAESWARAVTADEAPAAIR